MFSFSCFQLAKQGYAYYGSEPLYSGVSGTVMHADIYMGVVYYQRLRHMVHATTTATPMRDATMRLKNTLVFHIFPCCCSNTSRVFKNTDKITLPNKNRRLRVSVIL